MNCYREHLYLNFDGEEFFTMVLLPERNGKFPSVICRSPYVKHTLDMTEEAVLREYCESMKRWLERG